MGPADGSIIPVIMTAHIAHSSARCGASHRGVIIQALAPVMGPYMSRAITTIWGLFKKTYELAGPDPARFDVNIAAHHSRATIGDLVELELQAIRNPVTQAEVHPEVVLPEGLVVKRGSMAASRVFRVRGGVQYDHSGQYAAFGPFEYS